MDFHNESWKVSGWEHIVPDIGTYNLNRELYQLAIRRSVHRIASHMEVLPQ